MDLRKTVADILEGSSDKRIDEVTRILNDGGVGRADDLKYFDWKSLRELGGLSFMDINQIMRYVQENFPDEYEEHKRTRNEERKLKNETDILKCKDDHEKLQQMKMRFEEEKEARMKEQRELEEELTRSRQDQQNSSKKTNIILEGVSHAIFKKVKEFARMPQPYGNKEFPETYERHKRRRDNETQKMEELSKYKNIAQEQLKTRDENMNIEEVITKIFDGCSNAARIWKIEEILCYNGLKRADDLRHFDWKSLEDLGLTSAEANRITDFVKES